MILPNLVLGGAAPFLGYGHPPGVNMGDKFKDRGQALVVGAHATLMKGIHAPAKADAGNFARGAYSVVMSGIYVDDEDMGEVFWYTGEGGMDKGSKQVKDQQMLTGSNAALKNNCDTRTPVRVLRGYVEEAAPAAGGEEAAAGGKGGKGGRGGRVAAPKKEKGLVYEGLYLVLEYKMEPSKDGPLVCKFLMHGLPGHSSVNSKVEYGILSNVGSAYTMHARRLAGAGAPSTKRARKAAKDEKARELARQWMLSEVKRLYPGPELQQEDVSGGQEAVPIPVINQVNSERLPSDFAYTREYAWAPGVYHLVAPALRTADEEMRQFSREAVHGLCGIAFNRHIAAQDRALEAAGKLPQGYEAHLEQQYNEAGCLMVTDPCGVHECGSGCSAKACRRNMQLSQGVQLPLEVFMTASKGWGVRCREEVPAGAFVCCYVGQLITDAMAEVRKGVDHYLFDLDFFAHIYTEIADKGLGAIAEEIPLHKIPPVLSVGMIRQTQINAAAAARHLPEKQERPQPPAAAAAGAEGGGAYGGGAADAAAGPATAAAAGAGAPGANSAEAAAQSGGEDAAPGPGSATGSGAGAASSSELAGMVTREGVARAAHALAESCDALARSVADGASTFLGGENILAAIEQAKSRAAAAATATSTSGAAAAVDQPHQLHQIDRAVTLAAASKAAATAVESGDPGAFYLQPIISRDEDKAAERAGGAAAAPLALPATSGDGMDVEQQEQGGAAAAAGPQGGAFSNRGPAGSAVGAPRLLPPAPDRAAALAAGPVAAAAAAAGPVQGDGEEYAPMLVIDARTTGNVGRFINHSCDGNLTIQAVFAGVYRSTLLYHVGLYACRNIPPLEELSYNYGYHNQQQQQQAHKGGAAEKQFVMQCNCGAANCIGNLM
ncbi:hypothetical protein HXX76_007241 [Chlamydomonas incerta]|uniref:Uncharacterized protein n=1 Tax=Chlamydomonas incerta TaxID=51695 RepID=A0A835SXL2_CHLIN|nr:hypothetical protein HXX76_007241 [Chlamydomonas incerta]|eukprot:KAG2435157.1 hypothetical protein HXX76_007241 [Chlamydomonas incerta]